MSTSRGAGTSRSGQLIFGGLALVLLVALIGSVFGARNELRDQERAAQARAQGYVGSVLFAALTPELVSSPILGPDHRAVTAAVQQIFADDRVARIRIWAPDGTLVYSSDQRDEIGDVVAAEDPQIQAAEKGRTVSLVTEATVAPRSGLNGSGEKLYETFVPLHLFNQLGISGVAEIDQRFAAIQDAANRAWRPAQLAILAALLVSIGLFALSLRRAPIEPEAAVSGFEPVPTDVAAPVPVGATATRGSRETSERLRAAEERAAAAERAAREAEERALAAERKGDDLEGQLSAAVTARQNLEAETRAAAAARAALEAEVQKATVVAETDLAGRTEAQTAEELRGAMAELEQLRTMVAEAQDTLSSATSSAEEKEAALDELRAQHARAMGDLESVRETLKEREAELGSLKKAQTAASAAASAAEVGAREAQEAAVQVAELRLRVEELESQRREDVSALQRAQEALANTQVEAARAAKRAREAEARLRELEAAPPVPVPQPSVSVSEPAVLAALEEPMISFTTRLAELRREREREAEAGPSVPEGVPTGEDEGLSLRERLARAAAARHRVSGN